MIHTVKGFRVFNEAEVDVSLEFSCFFYDLLLENYENWKICFWIFKLGIKGIITSPCSYILLSVLWPFIFIN